MIFFQIFFSNSLYKKIDIKKMDKMNLYMIIVAVILFVIAVLIDKKTNIMKLYDENKQLTRSLSIYLSAALVWVVVIAVINAIILLNTDDGEIQENFFSFFRRSSRRRPPDSVVKLGWTIHPKDINNWKVGESNLKELSTLINDVLNHFRSNVCKIDDRQIKEYIKDLLPSFNTKTIREDELVNDLMYIFKHSLCSNTKNTRQRGIFVGITLRKTKHLDPILHIIRLVKHFKKYLNKKNLVSAFVSSRQYKMILDQGSDYDKMVETKDEGVDFFNRILNDEKLSRRIVDFLLKIHKNDNKLIKTFMSDLERNIHLAEWF